MSQLYPVHLGERDKYHVVEYPQGYSGLIRPDGSEVTSLTEPEDIHWHRELKPIHDELNILHQQLATLTQERDYLKQELDVTEKASAIFEQNSAACAEEFEGRLKAEKERDALREVIRALIRAGDALYVKGKFADPDYWAPCNWATVVEESANLLTPGGEAGKGGGV